MNNMEHFSADKNSGHKKPKLFTRFCSDEFRSQCMLQGKHRQTTTSTMVRSLLLMQLVSVSILSLASSFQPPLVQVQPFRQFQKLSCPSNVRLHTVYGPASNSECYSDMILLEQRRQKKQKQRKSRLSHLSLFNRIRSNTKSKRIGDAAANNNIFVGGEDEKLYLQKLAEAEIAIAAAEEARRNLLLRSSSGGEYSRDLQPPPPKSISMVDLSDAGSFEVTIPPHGIGSDSMMSAAFGIAWFSAITPATVLASGASLVMMLPFWGLGGLVAKNAAIDPFLGSKITIGQYAWTVQTTLGRKVVKSRDGATEDLQGAGVEVVAVINGKPQAEMRLYGKKGVTRAFGLGLALEELEYLANEINNHITDMKARSKEDTAIHDHNFELVDRIVRRP